MLTLALRTGFSRKAKPERDARVLLSSACFLLAESAKRRRREARFTVGASFTIRQAGKTCGGIGLKIVTPRYVTRGLRLKLVTHL